MSKSQPGLPRTRWRALLAISFAGPLVLLLLVLLAILSLPTFNDHARIHAGQTEKDVYSVLGRPTRVVRQYGAAFEADQLTATAFIYEFPEGTVVVLIDESGLVQRVSLSAESPYRASPLDRIRRALGG